jgi:hypothetical protein
MGRSWSALRRQVTNPTTPIGCRGTTGCVDSAGRKSFAVLPSRRDEERSPLGTTGTCHIRKAVSWMRRRATSGIILAVVVVVAVVV